MAHYLHRETFVPGDVATVFAFFKDPRNLEAITPPWLGFRITSTSDERVREGTRIRYRLRLHGIPNQLRAIFDYRTTLITRLLGAPPVAAAVA